ncbi:MAG: hypothetical protein WBE72_02535 [Terracidiphilus sp.]
MRKEAVLLWRFSWTSNLLKRAIVSDGKMAKSRPPKNTLRLTGPDSPPAENDFKALFAKHWQISEEFTLAVAEAMPAESHDFKPNPEEMTSAS